RHVDRAAALLRDVEGDQVALVVVPERDHRGVGVADVGHRGAQATDVQVRARLGHVQGQTGAAAKLDREVEALEAPENEERPDHDRGGDRARRSVAQEIDVRLRYELEELHQTLSAFSFHSSSCSTSTRVMTSAV